MAYATENVAPRLPVRVTEIVARPLDWLAENVAETNSTPTGAVTTSDAKAEVSPVDSFVAVAEIASPVVNTLDNVRSMLAFPFESVVTRVEPISVCPCPKPEGSAVTLLKNWTRNEVPGVEVRVPSINVLAVVGTAAVSVGAACMSLPPLVRTMPL